MVTMTAENPGFTTSEEGQIDREIEELIRKIFAGSATLEEEARLHLLAAKRANLMNPLSGSLGHIIRDMTAQQRRVG